MTAPAASASRGPGHSRALASHGEATLAPPTLCPLCGSDLGHARITTNAVWLVECSCCAGEGIAFWVTVQAGDSAARLRARGRMVDPERVRRLIGIRAIEGDVALVRQSDMESLVLDS